MALEGSIKDFGVADILQLIAQQQKTGVLLVEYEGIVAEIYFSAGAVIDATSSHHTARFEQIMVKSGMLSADIVKGARERAEKTLEPLYLVLLRENLVERDVLERILLTQLYETFYMILQWREGTYRFIPQPVKTTTNVVQVPSLETILLDVLRMIDEWPSLKSSIHSFAYVFEPNPEIARDTLDPEEIMVLGFFDGKKTVQDILDGSMLGMFSTCKIMVSLIEQGHLRLLGEKTEQRSRQYLSSRRAVAALSYMLLFLFMIGLLMAPTRFPHSMVPLLQQGNLQESPLGRYRMALLIKNAVTCLDLYF